MVRSRHTMRYEELLKKKKKKKKKKQYRTESKLHANLALFF